MRIIIAVRETPGKHSQDTMNPLSIILTLSLTSSVIVIAKESDREEDANIFSSQHHRKKGKDPQHNGGPRTDHDKYEREQNQIHQITQQLLKDIGVKEAPSYKKVSPHQLVNP